MKVLLDLKRSLIKLKNKQEIKMVSLTNKRQFLISPLFYYVYIAPNLTQSRLLYLKVNCSVTIKITYTC